MKKIVSHARAEEILQSALELLDQPAADECGGDANLFPLVRGS